MNRIRHLFFSSYPRAFLTLLLLAASAVLFIGKPKKVEIARKKIGFFVRRNTVEKIRSYRLNLEKSQIKKDAHIGVKAANAQVFHPFHLVLFCQNSADGLKKTLESIESQDYSNFAITCIDDASSDETAAILEDFSKKFPLNKVRAFRNKEQQGPLLSLYKALQNIPASEIVFPILGGDYLLHPKALEELNLYYQEPNVWLTFGRCVHAPSFVKGRAMPLSKKIMKNGKARKQMSYLGWPPFDTISFYAGLFKHIPLERFLYKGEFIDDSWEQALFLPLLDLAREKAVFVEDFFYASKRPVDRWQFVDFFAASDVIGFVRGQAPLNGLKEDPRKEAESSAQKSFGYDLLLYSFDRPFELGRSLACWSKRAAPKGDLWVLFRGSSEEMKKAYLRVAQDFPSVHFYELPHLYACQRIQKILTEMVSHFSPKNRFVAFGGDELFLSQKVDLAEGFKWIDHGARALVLKMAPTVDRSPRKHFAKLSPPPLTEISEGLFLWQFGEGKGEWGDGEPMNLTFYGRQDFETIFKGRHFDRWEALAHLWHEGVRHHDAAVCFGTRVVAEHPSLKEPCEPSELQTLIASGKFHELQEVAFC